MDLKNFPAIILYYKKNLTFISINHYFFSKKNLQILGGV